MLFGMGITLTQEENQVLATIIPACYSSLALANDYFSFDREWEDSTSNNNKPINAVWLFMQWQGLGVSAAKQMVRESAKFCERRFLDLSSEHRALHEPISQKLDLYLKGLSYQVSGNVIWSLNCPRYHPNFAMIRTSVLKTCLPKSTGIHPQVPTNK